MKQIVGKVTKPSWDIRTAPLDNVLKKYEKIRVHDDFKPIPRSLREVIRG